MIPATRQLKYVEIRGEVEKYLRGIGEGVRLPSERELARRFKCNVLTVRKALEPLVMEGRIERRIGSGTFALGARGDGVGEALRGGYRLGMLVHSGCDAYGALVIKSALEYTRNEGIRLGFAYVGGFGEEALREARGFASSGCDSLIIPWFPLGSIGEVAGFVRESPLPVSLPYLIPGLEGNCFEVPELFGKGTMTQTAGLCEYFRLTGCGRIALLVSDNVSDTIVQRRLGAYANYTFSRGIENISGVVGSSVSEMDALASKWAGMGSDLAVVCHDDLHAFRFMTAMRKLGLSAPGDYRIAGCNDSFEAAFSDPPLSSIYDDYSYAASWLVKHALALGIGGRDQSSVPARHFLAVRESCGGSKALNSEVVSRLAEIGITVVSKRSGDSQRSDLVSKAEV